jgi:hypothetical protein
MLENRRWSGSHRSDLVRASGRARRGLFLIGGLVVATSLGAPPVARAQTCTPNGYIQTILGAKMGSSTFVNVYWGAAWSSGAAPDISRGAIDAFTKAVIASDYFKASARNYGTGTPVFGGSIVDSSTPYLPQPASNPMDVPYMSNEVNHALQTFFPGGGPSDAVVNLIVPAGSMSKNLLNQTCVSGSYSAFHTASNITSTPFAVILLNPACFTGGASLDAVMTVMTHEMIETITDPGGEGYIHLAGPTGQSEVSDVCQNNIDFPPFPNLPFLQLHVEPYYSDDDCGCIPSWVDSPTHFDPLGLTLAPTLATINLALHGSGLGVLPPGFSLPLSGTMPYLEVHVFNGPVGHFAGNSIHGGGDPQNVTLTAWSSTEVDVSIPPSTVRACDTVSLQTFDPRGGASAIASARYGAPTTLTLSTAASGTAGVAQTVTVKALDAGGHTVPGVPVSLSGPGTFSLTNVTTGSTGTSSVTFTPPSVGTATITATASDCLGGTVTTTTSISVAAPPILCASVPMVGLNRISNIYTLNGADESIEADTTGTFDVPLSTGGSGTVSVLTRTIVGVAGSVAQGLRGYEYSIDMSGVGPLPVVGHNPSLSTFTLPFNDRVRMDFDGNGTLDDCYVITSGGDGDVAPSQFSFNNGLATLTFTGLAGGHASFAVGMLTPATPGPAAATATANVSGTSNTVDVRVPGAAPPVPALPSGGLPLLALSLGVVGSWLGLRRARSASRGA